ncbi:MAG: VOC family protein [Verrucomicrobia bacterium]|nr:VOC family protein [Verrucomicrobiota bacterium]
MFKGIEHIGILARDSAALARWYRETLGWAVVLDNKETPPAFFLATKNGGLIEIIPCKKAWPETTPALSDPGLRHLAIVVDDFDKAYAVLQAKKVNFIEPPKEGAGGAKVVFFRDPEGNILHLIYRPAPLYKP